MRSIRLGIILLALAGCAVHFERPGATREQHDTDLEECKYEASKATASAPGNALSTLPRQVSLVRECMALRGYREGGQPFQPATGATRGPSQVQAQGSRSFGVSLVDFPNRPGAVIVVVDPNSIADRAGVTPGDIVYEYGGKPISTSREFQKAVEGTARGGSVQFRVLRGNQRLEFSAQF
jgi:hypothetical protein